MEPTPQPASPERPPERIVLKRREEGLEPEFNNTSMTDVIFILLIFFISLSQIREGSVEVKTPQISKTAPATPDDEGTRVVVEVTAEGKVFLEGKELADADALVREVTARQKAAGKEIRVRLRGDNRANFGAVMGVLAGLADAGMVKIEFAVQAGKAAS